MEKPVIVLLCVLLLSALVQSSAIGAQQQQQQQQQSIQEKAAPKYTVRCRLYDQNCKLEINIKESKNFQEDLLNSTNLKIFEVNHRHLKAIKEQNGTAKSLETYEIPILTHQVGKAQLIEITPDGQTNVIAQVIITRPYRGIDIAFDVFLWVYCGLVSFIMGILVDRDLIKSVLTGNRQKEVGLTFGCQYLMMPLVIVY